MSLCASRRVRWSILTILQDDEAPPPPHKLEGQEMLAFLQGEGEVQIPAPCSRCAHLPESVLADAARPSQAALLGRKTVCVYCWQTRSECDGQAQCRTCIDGGRVCVHMRCDGDDACARTRCMRVHPSQSGYREAAWVIREGRMPEQCPRVEGVEPR